MFDLQLAQTLKQKQKEDKKDSQVKLQKPPPPASPQQKQQKQKEEKSDDLIVLLSDSVNPSSPVHDLQLRQTLKQKQKKGKRDLQRIPQNLQKLQPPSSPQQKQQQTTTKPKSPSAPTPSGHILISQLLNPSSPMYNKELGIKLQTQNKKTKEGNTNGKENRNPIQEQKETEQLETNKRETLEPILVTTNENEVFFFGKRLNWQEGGEI